MIMRLLARTGGVSNTKILMNNDGFHMHLEVKAESQEHFNMSTR